MNRKPSPFEQAQAAQRAHNSEVEREWTQRISDLESRLREAEAGAAAMREALSVARQEMQNHWHNKPRIGMEAVCAQADAALASDAGRALLERLETLERERQASCGYKHGWVPVADETMRTVKWARAQALADAAKVADGWGSVHGDAIAAAIRALKEGT